jgi:hypothetical protein
MDALRGDLPGAHPQVLANHQDHFMRLTLDFIFFVVIALIRWERKSRQDVNRCIHR